MKRRTFIQVLGAGAAALGVPAIAKEVEKAKPVRGLLSAHRKPLVGGLLFSHCELKFHPVRGGQVQYDEHGVVYVSMVQGEPGGDFAGQWVCSDEMYIYSLRNTNGKKLEVSGRSPGPIWLMPDDELKLTVPARMMQA